ncbi:MAG: acyltransferase [Rikenellaceae bacterium]
MDQLKGLSIFLVVMFHIHIFSFGLGNIESMNEIIVMLARVRMPLFFFLSGFVLKKAALPISEFPSYLANKFCHLMLPFFSVGLIYVYFIEKADFVQFVTSNTKLNYWYLYVLFILSIIVFFFNIISDKFCKKRIILDVLLAAGVCIMLLGIIYVIKFTIPSNEVEYLTLDITSLRLIAAHSVPLFFGLLTSKYNLRNAIFNNQRLFTIALLSFIALYCSFAIITYKENRFVMDLFGISGIIIVGYIFFSVLPKSSYIMDKLAYIGTKTLDVYVLHYFVMASISLSFLNPYLAENGFIELILLSILSIAVIATCIFVGHIIRQSRLLGFILLGAKYNPSSNK